MFGFHCITFVGVVILLSNLKEADSLTLQTNEKKEIDCQGGAAEASPITDVKEEANPNGETMARLKRTTLTTTIDGKFTVHVIVRFKPAEQVVPPQMARGGRLRTASGRVQDNPISRNCQNEYCDFAMELELLEQVPTSADSTGEIEEANKSRTSSVQGQVKTTSTPVSKFRSSRMHATTTTRYPMITPPIKPVLNRTKIATESTTRYSTSISRPSIKQVVNRAQTGERYQTRTPVNNNVTRINRIRTTGAGRSSPLSSKDSREDNLFLERRNENGPNKSRASAQREQYRGKPPKAATRLFQATRIQKKIKEVDPDVISTAERNQQTQTTDSQVLTENANHTDKQDDLNVKFDGPIFRNLADHLNSSSDEISVTFTTPAGEDVTRQTIISNDTVLLSVSLNDGMMSNATQLDVFNISMEPVLIQNDSFVTQSNGLLDVPLESSGNFAPTEQTLLNPTETDAPFQTSENPIISNSEEPDCLPWEQIGDFEFQFNPKSKQVVNIRLQTTTTTPNINPVTIPYEEQGNYSFNEEGRRQQEIGTPAATLEIPATVIPTQTVTPTVKMPIPLNRRKPMAVTQPERVDALLEPSLNFVPAMVTPMGVIEREKTVITEGTLISTTQNPEVFRLPGEYQQVVSRNIETAANISVQQTKNPEDSQKTEININSESITSEIIKPIGEAIPTQSEPAATAEIQLNQKPKVEVSDVDISLESVTELTPTIITSMAPVIPIQTTSTSPISKLFDESGEFPWEQRHDYEVQVNPETKQVVNIRMLTSTTHNILSVLPVEASIDRHDTTTAPDNTQVDLTKTNESVLTAEEQDELTVEVLGRILDRNGIVRTLVVPHRPRDNNGERVLVKHFDQIGDDFPGVKVMGTSRVAVTAPPRTVPNSRDRSIRDRKPIFSHTSEDGVFYFRYASEEDELKHYTAKSNNRNKQITDDERGTDLPQKESPYFYYSQDNNSSALVNSPCYIVLLVACVSFLFL